MDAAPVIDVMERGIALAVTVALPVLLVTLVVGLVVSLLQAVFSVQDQTLAAVPRLVVGALVVGLTASWVLGQSVDFTTELYESIPEMVRG